MVIWTRRFWLGLGFVGAAGMGGLGGMGCEAGAAEGTPSDVVPVETTKDPVATVPDPATDPVPDPEDPVTEPVVDPTGELVAHIDQNLETLRQLGLVEVGELVVQSPRAGGHCYGFPCDETEAAQIRVEKAAGLQALVDLAKATTLEETASCDVAASMDAVGGHIATLNNLAIVDLGAFIQTAPANNPLCYNLPCAEDIAAAAQADCAKVARLGQLAVAAAATFDALVVVTPSLDEANAIRDIDSNLSTLRSYDLFEVGELLFGADVERSSCYVCNPEPQWRREAAMRLEALADAANQVAADFVKKLPEEFAGSPAACEAAAIEANLAVLRGLQIVEVGAFEARDATGYGLCYVGQCAAADEVEAAELNCGRASQLDALVKAAAGL